MISFDNVSLKVIDGKKKYKDILTNVSFNLFNKGFIALYGKSGSGKTTIFNLLACDLKKTKGKIIVNGIDYDCLDEEKVNFLRKSIIGYISQENQLFNKLTVRENINISDDLLGQATKSTLIDKYATMLNLNMLLDEKISNLSGGEKQRASILITILRNPLIILADEPVSALDYENSLIVLDTLKEFAKDKLVIVSSHDRELINRYCVDAIELSYGSTIKTVNKKEDDVVMTSSNKSKGFFNISKKVLMPSKARIFFLSIVVSLILMLCLLFIESLIFNEQSYRKRAMKYSEYNDYVVCTKDVDLSQNQITFDDFKGQEYEGIKFKEFYLWSYLLTYYDIFGIDNDKQFFTNYIVDDSLADYEIVITDYAYEQLKDVIRDNVLSVDNLSFKIVGVEKTNFRDNIKDERNSGFTEDYCFYWYYNIHMNSKTYEDVCIYKASIAKIPYNDNFIATYVLEDILRRTEIDIICGVQELNDNEILIDPLTIYAYFGDWNVDDYSIYVGRNIDFEFRGFNISFKVKGVYAGYGDYPTFLMNRQTNRNLSTTAFVSKGFKNVCISQTGDVSDEFYDKLEQLNAMLYGPDEGYIKRAINEKNKYKDLSKFILPVLSILLFSICVFISGLTIKQNKRKIGILRRFGCSNKIITKIFVYNGLLEYSIGIVAAVIFYLVRYFYLNIDMMNRMQFPYWPYLFDIRPVLLFSILIVLIQLLTVFVSFKKIKLTSNKKLVSEY